MRKNLLLEKWASGKAITNGWLHIPSSWSAELMAHAGWDSITVDMQHGFHSIESVLHMLQAINTTDTVPIVRVNWNDEGIIMRVLDAGAYGVICPMVNTREECEAFVGAVRYPPLGYRSLGPTRARVVAGLDYGKHANDEILAIAMVETKEALENVEEIASVPGLSGIFVGAGDLRFSMKGEIGFDGDDEEFTQAIDRILAACQANDIVAGIFTASSEYANKMIERGFRWLTVKSDSMILGEYAKQLVSEVNVDID